MLNPEISRAALSLPREERLELARLLIESLVEPESLTDAMNEGVKRIEAIATGRLVGLTEEEYRAAIE